MPIEAEWEFAARGRMKTYGTAAFAYRYSGSDSYYAFGNVVPALTISLQ